MIRWIIGLFLDPLLRALGLSKPRTRMCEACRGSGAIWPRELWDAKQCPKAVPLEKCEFCAGTGRIEIA